MKVISLAVLLGIGSALNIKSAYKSDDMDDLIGSIIQNKHTPTKDKKQKSSLDTEIDEIYA